MMEDFVEQARKRHEQNILEFGIPERFIDGNDEKLWRFTAILLDDVRDERFSWPDLVLVKNEIEETIGTATLFPAKGNEIHCFATVQYNIPERLDHELGTPFEVIPITQARTTPTTGTVQEIKALILISALTGEDGDEKYFIVTDNGIL